MAGETIAELEYAAPASLAQALELAARPDAALLAGGTDLLGQIKDGAASPRLLISLANLPELHGVADEAGSLRLGAAVTLHELLRSDIVRSDWPLLYQAAAMLATPQLRSAATVGGNLCQRPRCWYFRNPRFDCFKKGGAICFAREAGGETAAGAPCVAPSPSDLAVALLAHDAQVQIAATSGRRMAPLQRFVLPNGDDPLREVDLASGELLIAIELPPSPVACGTAYVKEWDYDSWGFASANVAAVVSLEGSTVREARIAVGGLSVAPYRAREAESWLVGQALDEPTAAAAADRAIAPAEPPVIHRYRLPIARACIARALLIARDAVPTAP
jgi:xanthine dehydrogenase YagS FAD-binding subunit